MEDVFKPMKSQFWNQWMSTSIPMQNNMPPVEAAQTSKGRKLIDELLDLYDSTRAMSGGGSFDANVPTKYARWKLGYGPGTKEEFAEEEEIYNYTANNFRSTQRTEHHTKKLERKKASIYIPLRCEVKGCDKRGDDVKKCKKCHCAYYCGREHQSDDWARHKLDCKALSKMPFDWEAKRFLPSKELDKYPLACFPVSQSENKPQCFICESKSSEVDITYTECCNLPVCDNSHEYQFSSYSRDFCYRSHRMYTACATHHDEGHEGDWRACADCNRMSNGARPFSSTNRFCVTPCFEQFLPQGSFLTFPCENPGCKSRMLPGHSAYSYNGKVLCEACGGP